MANDEYYIVYKSILPEYFESVINAKSMVEDEKQSVSNACKKFNISRSTYYKYKDKIFTASKSYGRKCIFGIRAGDKKGVLSAVIAELYESGANIISINSTLPVKGAAYVTITIDLSDVTVDTAELLGIVKAVDHVRSASIIAIE
ncbi:MAG: hypothetical protein ILP02_04500 [Clostridia bacterium]|nr:hypothetical protein [Clostridia bacterium]